MIQFRTALEPQPIPQPISIKDTILLMGSCFSSSVGNRLVENKFDALVNPFGVLFNPLSILNILEWVMEDTLEEELKNFYLLHDQVWYNHHLHSQLAHPQKESLAKLVIQRAEQTKTFLKKSNYLVLTLGTSFLYKLDGTTIANCHRQPKEQFTKQLMNLDEVLERYHSFFEKLNAFGNKKQLILTVSPIRHLKEGLVENATSKALLKVLCHELSQQEGVYYFPSYELLLDDLRDYRFYESDLLHPSAEAITYIWEKFVHACMDTTTKDFLGKWTKIQSSLLHKPFFSERKSHQTFLKKLLCSLEETAQHYPFLNLSSEIQKVKAQLI